MSTPTVTEIVIALEPVTRDDFAGVAPAQTDANRRPPRGPVRGSVEATHMSRPPLTPQTWPVMYPEASAARNTTTRATSSGRPMRRTGIAA